MRRLLKVKANWEPKSTTYQKYLWSGVGFGYPGLANPFPGLTDDTFFGEAGRHKALGGGRQPSNGHVSITGRRNRRPGHRFAPRSIKATQQLPNRLRRLHSREPSGAAVPP